MTRNYIFPLLFILASCGSLEKSDPTPITVIGYGTVVSAQSYVGESGETSGDRALKGMLMAGPLVAVGAAASTEDHLGEANQYQYDLRMRDGSRRTVISFSIMNANDCVKISKVGDHNDLVLERSSVQNCQP